MQSMTADTTLPWPLRPVFQEFYVPFYQEPDLPGDQFLSALPGPVTLEIQVEFKQPRPDLGTSRFENSRDWITIVLAIAFVLFAFVRFNFPKRLFELLKATLFPRSVSLLYKKGNPFNEQISLILSIIYLISSSLLVFLVAERFEVALPRHFRNEYIYAAMIAINGMYWLLKSSLMRVLAHIFKTQHAATNYLFNNLLFNMALGLLLIITLPLVIYTGSVTMMNLALHITGFFLAYKVLRNVLIGLTIDRFPVFYLILYIFMLELAPLLIVVKLIMNHSA